MSWSVIRFAILYYSSKKHGCHTFSFWPCLCDCANKASARPLPAWILLSSIISVQVSTSEATGFGYSYSFLHMNRQNKMSLSTMLFKVWPKYYVLRTGERLIKCKRLIWYTSNNLGDCTSFSIGAKYIMRDVSCHKLCPCFPPRTDFNIKERAFRYSVGTLYLFQWFRNLSINFFEDLIQVSVWCLSSRLAFQFTLEEAGSSEVLYIYHIFIDLLDNSYSTSQLQLIEDPMTELFLLVSEIIF